MESTNEDFPSRVAEKFGRKNFAKHIGANEEKAKFTKDLEPHLEEFKRAAEKKSAAQWIKIADYLEKEGGITKRQREGTMCGQMWMV